MQRLIAILVVAFVVALSGAGTTTAQNSPPVANPAADLAGHEPLPLTGDRLAEFESYVDAMLAKTGLPGASVAVVQDGEVVYGHGFGVKDLGGTNPVTPDSLMMIGSITKPMTATMAATLVDDGTLTWETPVVDLLPDFAVADPALTARLSLADAFCACTGLPQRDPEFIFTSATLTPGRLVTSVKDFPLTAQRGELFQYSNQMFAIGGYAAAAAGTDVDHLADAYATAMHQRLLAPLGMARSTFALDQVVAGGDYALPHGRDLAGAFHPLSAETDHGHATAVAPAGALWSSAAEMARFVQMELAGGVGPDGARVVSGANLDATWQPQVAIPAPANPGVPAEFVSSARGYGLGWVTGDYRGQRLLWHSGGTFGFSSQAALLPDADLGLVVLTNGVNASMFTLAVQYRLFELVFGQPATFDPIVSAAIDGGAAQTAALQQQLGPIDPDAVAPYLGRYAHDVLGEVELALGDGTLILDAGEFRATFRPLRDAPGPGTTYLTADLPLTDVPTTITLTEDAGIPLMTLTDPTTGEAYAFAFTGASGSQAATPVAGPVAPDPAECTVAPRSLEAVVAVAGTPTASAPPAANPTPFIIPAGTPADADTTAAATATVRHLFACTNAGDFLRVYALFSDDFLRTFLAGTPLSAEVQAFLAAPPVPLPADQRRIIVRFGEAQILPDGRVGLVVVLDEPDDPRTEEPDYVILVETAGRWLVAAVIEDGGAPATPTP